MLPTVCLNLVRSLLIVEREQFRKMFVLGADPTCLLKGTSTGEQIVAHCSRVGMEMVLMNIQREGIKTVPVIITKRANGAGLSEGFKKFGGSFVHCILFQVLRPATIAWRRARTVLRGRQMRYSFRWDE